MAETLIEISGHVTLGPPKTRNGRRTVPLPRSVVTELEAHLTEYADNQNDSFVFTGPEGGPLRRGLFRTRVWVPAVKAADLEGLRFHDLRHTFVALWVDTGVDPKEVSVRAGHSSVAFTLDRYGHLFEDDEDTISERLDAVLQESKRPAAGGPGEPHWSQGGPKRPGARDEATASSLFPLVSVVDLAGVEAREVAVAGEHGAVGAGHPTDGLA